MRQELKCYPVVVIAIALSFSAGCRKQEKKKEDAPAPVASLPFKAVPPADRQRVLGASDPDAQSPAIPADLEGLLEALGNPAGIPRDALYSAIKAYGRKALPALFKALSEGSHELRLAVVRLLGEMKEYAAEILPQLVARLETESVIQVRSMVVDAIVRLDRYDEMVKNALLRALSDAAWLVRWEAVRGIGNLGAKARELVPHLEARFADASNWVQLYAAISVLKLVPATDALAEKAQRQLEMLTLDADVRFRLNVVGQIEGLAQETCPRTAPALVKLLADPEIRVRRPAAKALSVCAPALERSAYVEALQKAASDADYSVRTHAAKALEALPAAP